MRPVLLAAGLGLFWFAEYQDHGGTEGAPMWGYLVVGGVRILADIVVAWVAVSLLQLVLALLHYGMTYVRALWAPESR
jgi:hypothetical protein